MTALATTTRRIDGVPRDRPGSASVSLSTVPRLLADYAVPAGAGLVDLQVEMLELGAISVHGATVVELTQETFQCFFRCLGDTVPPDVSEELRRQLNSDHPAELDGELLRAAGAPLPAGLYDVIDAEAPVTGVRHTGICVSCPSDYRAEAGADAWGVEVREAGTQVRIGYGRDVPQPTATLLYRASLGELGLVLLPLTGAPDRVRIDHYAGRLASGARPTVLAFGSYANERCAVAVVLDGHHKLAAAAAAGSPLGLLVFLSSRLLVSYADCRLFHGHPSVPTELARRRITGKTQALHAWADELEVTRHHRPPRRGS